MLYKLVAQFLKFTFSVWHYLCKIQHPVKAEKCRSINQQTKVSCKQLVFSFISDSSTVSRSHYQPVYVRQCKMLSVNRTVQCCHIALRAVVAVQHSDCSGHKHTAEHLQHRQLHRHTWGWYRPQTNCRSVTQHPVPCSDRSSTVRLYRNRELIHCLI
jgi:hypothetical protein